MGVAVGRALLALVFGTVACSSGDADSDRQGQGGTGSTMDGGSGPVGAAGAGSGELVTFCSALQVMRDKCQRCHQDPPKNGAPAPFMTYEDTQAKFGGSGETYADAMVSDVERDAMPLLSLNRPPTNLMPPVEPLTAKEKDTLLSWLKQGAKPVGGTDCP